MKIYYNNYSRQNSAFPCAKGESASSFFDSKENEKFLSPKFKNQTLTFSGVNTIKALSASGGVIAGAKKFFAKHFMREAIVVSDYSKLVGNTNALIGNDFLKGKLDEFHNLMGDDASRFMRLENNKLTVYERTVSGKLLSGILDVAKLPLDILGAGIKGIANIPGIKDTKASEALKNIPFIKKRADEKTAMDLYYKIKGTTSLKNKPFKIRQNILSVPAGKSVGNYNTKDERGLNRLATGAISSIFVGMDFYNLVMYEKNNKEEAQKAGKKRRNRELMRIGTNALMTYSVLGAFSSYTNKSKAAACAAIAGSALFAEIITRVIAGTPLVPLSPEGAKKYNQKKLEKEKRKTQKQQPDIKEKPTSNTINTDTNKQPQSIQQGKLLLTGNPLNQAGNVFNQFASYEAFSKKNTSFKGGNMPEQKRETKSPITLNRAAFALVAVTIANLAYSLSRAKIPKFDSLIKGIEQGFGAFYKKYSTRDLIVNSKTLRKLLEGFDGTDMGAIKHAYARVLDVCFTEKEVKQLLNASKGGVIHITSKDKVFSSAFRRTSNDATEKFAQMLSDKDPNAVFSRTTKMLSNEISDISKIRVDKQGNEGTYQKFKSIDFEIDFENAKIIDGIKYYPMKNAEYNFGRIKETKTKILLDAITYPFKAVKNILSAPGNLIRKLSGVPTAKELQQMEKKTKADPFPIPNIGELYKDCSFMFKKYESGKISKEEFAKYMNNANTKLLNMDTTPTYPQTALASLSRNFVTLITSYFFINDFRNEVLIQSNGENTEKAKEVTNERIAHKLSNFVLNKFFMELFNSTFQKYYLGSLAGATAVATATEMTNESCVRLSIGVPIGNKNSREEIEEFEKKHLEKEGITGAYYRLMAKLTGKKMLSEKSEK